MNWTKTQLQRAIDEARLGVELTASILMAVKEFAHHTQVTKRFVDRIKELDCHAFIQKDKFSTTLFISKGKGCGMPKAEFRLYISHVFNKECLTWNAIRKEIIKYDFEGRLQSAKECLELIDKETEEAKELLALLKSKKFKCFDFYKGIHEIADAVSEALK